MRIVTYYMHHSVNTKFVKCDLDLNEIMSIIYTVCLYKKTLFIKQHK